MNRLLGFLVLSSSVLAPGLATADVIVAAAGPMTGQYASFGDQFRRGAEMAVKDINAAGGVLGEQLSLVIGDDACDPKQAVAVANQLAGQGVVFVAGHFCSGSSIPASAVYSEEQIVMMSPGSTNPQLTERGLEGIYRVCGRDDQQGRVAAEFIADNYRAVNVAILHDKTAYGAGIAKQVQTTLRESGIEEVIYDSYSAGEKDYFAIVERLKNEEIGLLYIGGYHTEVGLIRRQATDAGMSSLVMMSGDGLATDEFWSITGHVGAGTLFTFSPDPRKNPGASELVERFKEAGFNPEGYTLYAYATVQAFAQAASKAGSTDFNALNKTLHAERFDTILGSVRFDEKGDVDAPGYVVYRWDNGAYDYAK